MILYHNGEFIEETPLFDFQDRLRLGDGVFDTMLIIDGNPAHHDLHIDRLLHDAAILKIDNLTNTDELKNAALKLIESNESFAGRFALNTLITRGPSKRGLMPSDNAAPTIAMRISEAPKTFPDINAIISTKTRRNEGSEISRIKSCNYGDNILALLEAREQNANDAILLNNKGNATCATAGNIFCCINNRLVTPPLIDGVLDGITRKILIENLDIEERSINEEELKNAAGIYITNSIRGITPVRSLNGKTMPEPSIKIDKDFHLK